MQIQYSDDEWKQQPRTFTLIVIINQAVWGIPQAAWSQADNSPLTLQQYHSYMLNKCVF